MTNKTSILNYSDNKAEFSFETPLMIFKDNDKYSVKSRIHERQHVVDLFSLYPSPLLNSTVLNFLVLKAHIEGLYKHNQSAKSEWLGKIEKFLTEQERIRNDYYKTTEEDKPSNFKLDTFFEATAIEKQAFIYLRELFEQNKKNFGTFASTPSAKREHIRYQEKLFNLNIQYDRVKFLHEFFFRKPPGGKGIRDVFYRNAVPLFVKYTYEPPDLDTFFNGEIKFYERFPISPSIEKIQTAHFLNAGRFLRYTEDAGWDHSKLIKKAIENCNKWIKWIKRLKQHLKKELQVNGEEVYSEELLIKYAIDLPLENIIRANKMDKIFIEAINGDEDQKHALGHRNELMLNSGRISKLVPEQTKLWFKERRKEIGIEHLITSVPEIYFKDGDVLYSFRSLAGDDEEDRFQYLHWVYFLTFNEFAKNPEEIFAKKKDYYQCPIPRKLKDGKRVAKNCRKIHNLRKENPCKVNIKESNRDLEKNYCYFRGVLLHLIWYPILKKEDKI